MRGITRVVGQLSVLAMVGFIGGCIFGNDDPEFPPLTKEELVGCWYATPPPLHRNCWEECYSRGGGYFLTSKKDVYGEFFGTYKFSGNTIKILFKSKSSRHNETSSAGSSGQYHIENDTLFLANSQVYIRSDSIHNCKPHFLLFEKPEGWDEDVKPYSEAE